MSEPSTARVPSRRQETEDTGCSEQLGPGVERDVHVESACGARAVRPATGGGVRL